jgi:hypothetical protein
MEDDFALDADMEESMVFDTVATPPADEVDLEESSRPLKRVRGDGDDEDGGEYFIV